jgi:hypothetical protein
MVCDLFFFVEDSILSCEKILVFLIFVNVHSILYNSLKQNMELLPLALFKKKKNGNAPLNMGAYALAI